jgi:hypothetical protein
MRHRRSWIAGRVSHSRENSLAGCLGSGQSAVEAKLRRVSGNAVSGVEVLDDQDLEASGAALAGSNDRPGEEELPNLRVFIMSATLNHRGRGNLDRMTYPEPPLAVLGLDGIGVANPVAVPPPNGGRVVNTDGVNAVGCQYVSSCCRTCHFTI